MPCSLFVPTVKGSRQCAACQSSLDEHRLTAIYVEPSTIFTAPNTPATRRKQERWVVLSSVPARRQVEPMFVRKNGGLLRG
ncbi:unnamed protein product [Heligmosomoides polygyrus]|uniref:Secreted protein n=1 Tax=Heligmosomoides polygyrus TaxID=6339 RepID=A0A183GMU7_HELPZ|nr:unnamed protein product [Heligmosomoides polygyrus]